MSDTSDFRKLLEAQGHKLAALELALRNLLERADDHWRDKGCKWKEQEHARSLLASIDVPQPTQEMGLLE